MLQRRPSIAAMLSIMDSLTIAIVVDAFCHVLPALTLFVLVGWFLLRDEDK